MYGVKMIKGGSVKYASSKQIEDILLADGWTFEQRVKTPEDKPAKTKKAEK